MIKNIRGNFTQRMPWGILVKIVIEVKEVLRGKDINDPLRFATLRLLVL